MRLFLKCFVTILSLLLFSCKKEDPQPSLARITLTGILIQKSIPSGRLSNSQVWIHELSPGLNVTFTSQENGDAFSISLPADPEGFTFELPFGTYRYESNPSTVEISNTLPVNLSGTLTALNPEVTTQLEGSTNYHLLSIQKTNLESPPRLISPQTGVMASQGDFYYIYSWKTIVAEIQLTQGQRFRLGIDPIPFQHQSFFYPKSSTPDEPTGLNDPILDFSQRTISLTDDRYPQVFQPFNRVELGFPLEETSGLEAIGQRLFTMNDGGNLPELFEISPDSGTPIRMIRVNNATNVDWEDLASSDTHLYVGDFGNNLGNRKDLKILKIPLMNLLNSTTVNAEILEFSYPDQTVFDDPNHAFDCEAMIFYQGKLHLFTKPVSSNETTHYTLDPNLPNQVAVKVETFSTAGKITAADITSDGKNLVLLGYELAGISSRAFVEVFSGWDPEQILNSSQRYSLLLGSVAATSQTEGIGILHDGSIKISGEKISVAGASVPSRLFEIDLTGLLED
ncbi:hypothetical protein Aoki45_34410 [Algoriphagus sp. oki45]|uniref:hypothetical protein n=1 Tax=Algoriphagus sp. oki45 TaxID=3067294 RepID=UPI0027EEE893|nr:hypothetical protein Aoki45_34410 [Algoriphagus sp. oki45]